jgi:hypothetical protein
MTNFATITPTRGDRPELLKFVTSRLIDSDVPCYAIIDYKPKSEEIDLIPRIKKGVEDAKAAGYDFVFIVEDDDFYNKEYFTTYDWQNHDFVGYSDTVYYNIKNKTYQTFEHENRSSLFCTGFRISALDRFDWPRDDYKWLDVKLWEYANRYNKRIQLLKNNPTLGIKHGLGKCAGKGHSMLMKNGDGDLSFLKSRIDEEAFKFYTELMKKL